MPRASSIMVAMLMLWASAAHSELRLTWNSCSGDGGIPNIEASCAVATPHDLIATFQVPSDLESFVALNAVIDLDVESGANNFPFWHLEAGGCNEGGVILFSDTATVLGTCRVKNPWVNPGGGGSGLTVVRLGNVLRLGLQVARSVSSPIRLQAGTEYYGFHLRFSSARSDAAGGSCAGCEQKVAMVWNRAEVIDLFAGTVQLIGSYPCATWNSASAAMCFATPTRISTWGELKVMYR